MILADLDDDFATAGQRKPVATLPQQWLANGTFTITFPCGTHKTLRIHTQQLGAMAGKRIISLLIGPDNSHDYEGIGELTPSDVTPVWVWKRWKNQKPGEYAQLLWLLLKGEELEGYELVRSSTCLRCNRPLTHPSSVADNLGPECRKKEAGRGSK